MFNVKATNTVCSIQYAGVAELADALDLGSSVQYVGVQVPPPAPQKLKMLENAEVAQW